MATKLLIQLIGLILPLYRQHFDIIIKTAADRFYSKRWTPFGCLAEE